MGGARYRAAWYAPIAPGTLGDFLHVPAATRHCDGSPILAGGWYPFELNQRLDEAIAAEMGIGDNVFLLMGEKSAVHNLTGPHRALLSPGDPHGLLKRTPQIYQMYYDVGRRTYERAGDKKAILRTYDAPTFSRHDCLTVVGWHRKAIAM